ncbi:MAG: hypothetical protein MPJ50_08820 [Pirellulales bacterium]|nr:hypothetical protein [Pirellulales bacterium]
MLETSRVQIALPMYSLLHVKDAAVLRAAFSKESNAVFLFSERKKAEASLKALNDSELRPVEHADRDRLANFLEDLVADHGISSISIDPDLVRNRSGSVVSMKSMIAQLRDE